MGNLGYYLGITPTGALAIVLSTVLLYGSFAFVLSRWGQRLYASPSSLELAVVTVLGAIVGRAILGHVPTLSGGMLALTTLFVMEAIMGKVRRSERMKARTQYRAVAVMVRGRPDRRELARHGLDESALWSALRRNGVSRPQDAALVILERDGHISVVRAGQEIHPAALTGVRRATELRHRLERTEGGRKADES